MSRYQDDLMQRHRDRYTIAVKVLDGGGLVPAKEIAARTGTSVRTVYRFIYHLDRKSVV